MELRKRRNTMVTAALTAALAISSMAGAVAAQDEDADPVTLTGVVVVVVDEDGATEYFLDVDGELVRLDVGPPWFWGEEHPFDGLDGQTVSVEGREDDGVPDEQASDVAKEQAEAEPSFDVESINGDPLWTTETPPWAGGPKVVGESHPGYKGWSWGQAHRQDDEEDDDEDRDDLAGGPAVVGPSHPGHEGWSKGQAAREAKGNNGERGRANAERVKESKSESKARGPKSSKGQAARGAAHARAEQARGGRGNEKKDGRDRP